MNPLIYAQAAPPGGGILSMLLPLGGIAAVFYFFIIRPQQKQRKNHQSLIAGLKKGDEVILSSGIIGRIYSVEDKFVILEVSDKTKLRILKQAVQSLSSRYLEENKKA